METLLQRRPRRLRQTPALRELVQETFLRPSQLVVPLFVVDGEGEKQPVESLPGVYRFSIDTLTQKVIELYEKGIRAVDLFPVLSSGLKDAKGSEALRPGNLLTRTLQHLKKEIPEMCLMVDVALDPYTSHGHDGVLDVNGAVDNDRTLEILAQKSLLLAEAGADVLAPSDMMDGRVGFIRQALDDHGLQHVSILSYTAKYASSLYGPFRDLVGSTPQKGDKKGYQMNPANAREALTECQLDIEEGADMLLVKPALHYLDILARLREETTLPLAAYHVSGEYAMVLAAAEKGWLDADQVLLEQLISIKRAGADLIFTYAAERVLENLQS